MAPIDQDLGRRWFELIWNQGRREAIAELLAPDAAIHDGGVDTMGPGGFYPFFDRIRSTFSEMHVEVEDCITEGDRSCVRWSCTGRHTGSGLGMDPTGVNIHITGIAILRVKDGKVIEAWQNWDMLGMLEQIKGIGKSATYIGAR